MTTSETVSEIGKALAKAQAEIGHATRNATNPHFRSDYADLAAVIDASKPHLTANGIAVIQAPEYADGIATVATRMIHSSGEWVESRVSAPVGRKQDPQAVGSAITYLRRYGLAAMVGVHQQDDDANAAAEPAKPAKQSKPAKQTKQEAPEPEQKAPLLPSAGTVEAAKAIRQRVRKADAGGYITDEQAKAFFRDIDECEDADDVEGLRTITDTLTALATAEAKKRAKPKADG